MNSVSPPIPSPLDWLLDPAEPGVRYLALRDLLRPATADPELAAARRAAHAQGPIATVLDKMNPAGYWETPGPGYNPKYTATVWSLILLAQLGAAISEDQRIERACEYVLEEALTPNGQFSASGAPSGTCDCLQGNLCWALLEMGCADPRMKSAYDWMARSVTGEGIAPAAEKQAPLRYYAGKCGPLFACGSNLAYSCAWGAAKVMLALARWPAAQRTPIMDQAIAAGTNFLFSCDPASAAYPSGMTGKPSQSWWKFGFPVFYVTDVLQIAEALAALGHIHDARLQNTLTYIRQKQDSAGRWSLEYEYNGKTWVEFGAKKQPNKWVTLRALRVLRSENEIERHSDEPD